MCLCSALQQQQPLEEVCREDFDGITQWVESLGEFLGQLDRLLSTNERLASQLPFTLNKRKLNPKPPEGEQRIAKIFEFDPTEYHTRTLLKLNIKKWAAQPSSFTQLQKQLVYSRKNPAYEIIFESLQLQQSDAHSCILRRFQSVALYRQRERQARNDDAKTIASALFPLIHPPEDGDDPPEDGNNMQDLSNTIETLIQAGPRYDSIGKRLCLGSLFLLGDAIPNNIWEKWLPSTGSRFDRAMDYLIEKGIVTIGSKYNELGEKILAYYDSRLPVMPEIVWMNDNVQGKHTKPRRQRHSQKKATAPAPNPQYIQVDRNTTNSTKTSQKRGSSNPQLGRKRLKATTACSATNDERAEVNEQGHNGTLMQALLTVVEHEVDQIPAESSSTLGPTSLTTWESHMPFDGSAPRSEVGNLASFQSNGVSRETQMSGSDSRAGNSCVGYVTSYDSAVNRLLQSSNPLSQWSLLSQSQKASKTWVEPSGQKESSQVYRQPENNNLNGWNQGHVLSPPDQIDDLINNMDNQDNTLNGWNQGHVLSPPDQIDDLINNMDNQGNTLNGWNQGYVLSPPDQIDDLINNMDNQDNTLNGWNQGHVLIIRDQTTCSASSESKNEEAMECGLGLERLAINILRNS
ncbi:hypothetical protein VC83_07597 [Pseudogymnoascus destructans]|uniref:Uncharacterized protein n=2 Tax=Pseudogymnoascus destructans TaxID=655981 RepID=A0A177A059_9PEZI|nr:uncharacterized protein VC83_07597 [Pseudogymnoascus destructans]OAF55528.1 hypothetical protein VC83_07597 [Pseudogymnoascus destructans]